MIARLLSTCLIAAAALAAPPQQRDTTALPPPGGSAAIAGVVMTDDQASAPVRRVIVTIAGAPLRGTRQTVTNDQGQFAFSGLAAGRYTLSASKAGWLTSYFGSKRPGRPVYGEPPVNLAAAQSLTGLTLRLLHGSAITGTIRDQAGRPAQSCVVAAMQVRVENGERHLTRTMGNPGSQQTDDRGVYRLYDLPPGDYVVSASPGFIDDVDDLHQTTPDDVQAAHRAPEAAASASAAPAAPANGPLPIQGAGVRYSRVYFPGTGNASSATILTIGPAEEKTGVDFSLALVPAARISGTIVSPTGEPIRGGQLRLVLRGSAPGTDVAGEGDAIQVFADTVGNSRVMPDGTFTITSVPPGDYTLVARAVDRAGAPPDDATAGRAVLGGRVGGPAAQTLWAIQDLSVDGRDLSNVALTLQHGLTVGGHLQFAGMTAPPDALLRARVALMPAGMTASPVPPASINQNGDFTLLSVIPGPYRVSVQPPPGWSVVSAMAGAVDAIDKPFDVRAGEETPSLTIRFVDHPSQISGTLVDAAGKPAPDYLVVVFSADRTLWGVSGRRVPPPAAPGLDGKFRVTVPPGEYFIAVATDLDQTDLRETSVLEELAAKAFRVTVGEGENKVQDFKIGGH